MRRWAIASLCLGATLMIGGVGFRVLATPSLVRFPLNVDETTKYTGTASTYVDQATLLPLKTPKTEPVSISRHVKVVSGTHSRAVIDETVTVTTGAATTTEQYQYVIDRRTMQMVSDPRQIAFGDSKAVMHAAGTYRVNFSMGTNAKGNYRAFIPEEDAYSHLVLAEGPHYHADARLTVIDFKSHLDGPVAPYYLAHLKAMGLPMEVTAAQLEPLLRANGIDVNKALADVGSKLTPAESKLVATTLAKAVPLRYSFLSDGLISIEPATGALIDVHTQQQGVAVRPDLTGASALQPLLDRYSAIPSVKALSDGLARMAKAAPQVAQDYKYTQTVASSLEAARDARDNATTMNLVEVRLPWGLALLGALFLAGGSYGWRRGRSGRPGSGTAGPGEPATPPVTEPPVHPERAPQPVDDVPVPVGTPGRTYEGV